MPRKARISSTGFLYLLLNRDVKMRFLISQRGGHAEYGSIANP
jgi:hypothetical protein